MPRWRRLRLDTPDFPEAVRWLVHALRPGGALYISIKQDERASAGDGRVFWFWTMDEALAAIFDGRTPLERVEDWVSVDEGDEAGECGGEAERVLARYSFGWSYGLRMAVRPGKGSLHAGSAIVCGDGGESTNSPRES